MNEWSNSVNIAHPTNEIPVPESWKIHFLHIYYNIYLRIINHRSLSKYGMARTHTNQTNTHSFFSILTHTDTKLQSKNGKIYSPISGRRKNDCQTIEIREPELIRASFISV